MRGALPTVGRRALFRAYLYTDESPACRNTCAPHALSASQFAFNQVTPCWIQTLTGASHSEGSGSSRSVLTGFHVIGPRLTGGLRRGIDDDGDLILYASEHEPCSNGQFKGEDWEVYKYRNIVTKKLEREPR